MTFRYTIRYTATFSVKTVILMSFNNTALIAKVISVEYDGML